MDEFGIQPGALLGQKQAGVPVLLGGQPFSLLGAPPVDPEAQRAALVGYLQSQGADSEPQAELRPYTPSPSENRRFWLEQNIGRYHGGRVNAALDWLDPFTPLLDFAHRREQGYPVGWEDAELAVGALPGAGKVGGKVSKAVSRIPPYKRPPSRQADFASEIGRVLETGESSKGKLFRSDLGEITIDLGTPGDPTKDFKGGWGLSHVRDKRTAVDGIDGEVFVRKILPQVLSRGKLSSNTTRRGRRSAILDLGDYQANFRLERDGAKETWLLTGFHKTGPR